MSQAIRNTIKTAFNFIFKFTRRKYARFSFYIMYYQFYMFIICKLIVNSIIVITVLFVFLFL